MNTTTLEAVCESVRYGYTESATADPVGPHFLRITDIVPQSIDWDSVPYCKIDEDQLEKYKLLKGDIVVARTGATVGYAKLIRKAENAVFASYLVRFRVDPNKADPGYVGRVVESAAYKQFIWSRINGAAQPNASAPVLASFEFRLPSLVEQKKIAAILTNYDELITTNQRRIALLEEAARRLYREWFVLLRFPGHESVPVKDGVPEGWEQKPLGDIAPLNYGKALKSTERKNGKVPVYGSSGIVGMHNIALVDSGAIIVGRKGNVGSLYFSPVPCFPIDTVYYIAPAQASYRLFLALHQLNFISSDAAVPGLNRTYAHSLPVLQPSDDVASAFERLIQPVFEQSQYLTEQNVQLAQARDLLLPKLMSGQLDVSSIRLPEEMAA